MGPSGSGKSTIIGLISAFYTPAGGRILVDGSDLSTVRLSSYRTQLGVVLQETFLFDGSIRENVAYARPNATEEEILAACRIARVDEFAETFEKKYDTVVGERGVKLSGGQKQRVSIARAILADPRILILDEATSSLDSESEALIQEGLRYLMRGRTTFVIAHRLSTIRRAEQILVVQDGRILERGTHQTLYAAQGRYFELFDGSIRENVAYARPNATEEETLAACRIARVDEFAETFEKKYDTVVGERGVILSGGQKQRVSIARAILADPRILILDEATSSLDSESEALIQEGLRYLMRGRTTFVIAHRLSTIRRAEQILAGAGWPHPGTRHAPIAIRRAGPLLRAVHQAA